MELKTPYLLFLGSATDKLTVKIANSIADWRPDLCVGEFGLPGCSITMGFENLTLEQAVDRGARTLVVTMNNEGGYIDPEWIDSIIAAIEAGLDVATGLHERLSDVDTIVAVAEKHGSSLIDVRHSSQSNYIGTGAKRSGNRLLTVGTDCSVGKMYTALALEREMQSRGIAADFVATGQCGIFICGKGIAIDTVGADFISGTAEMLSPDNDIDHWDIMEGQGSLSHPAYAGVSLGLLHGSQPDALVLCHTVGRDHMRGLPDYDLPQLEHAIAMNLEGARRTNPRAQFVGVSVNTSSLAEDEASEELDQLEQRLSLPCVDPLRTGVSRIVDRLLDTFPGTT